MKHLSQYQFYLLTESIILASEDVSNILSKCVKTKVGLELWLIVGDKKDVTTDFNTLGLSDKNDELFFLPDAKTQKLLSDGEEPFGKNKQSMKIGRIARAILTKNNISVTDKDIEEFVNEYKAQYDIKKNKENAVDVIKLVEGEDIRHWYLVDNYEQEGLYGSDLGNSCMRHSSCQKYFDIYVDNPDQCKLLIYLTPDNKLKGRALFWTLHYPSDYYYLDRIYTVRQSDAKVMTQWLCENLSGDKKIIFYENKPNHERAANRSLNSGEVILDNGSFDYYPYMDTFQYYTPDSNKLSSDEGDLELQSTDGQATEQGVYCDYEGETYPEDETVYSDYHNVSMHRDNASYSEYHSDYIWSEYAVWSERDEDYYHRDEAKFSEHLDDYLLETNAAEVYLDADDDKSDYYDKDSEAELFAEDEFSGNNYLMGLLTPNNGKFILTKYAIKAYKSTDNKPEMILDPVVSELDAKLFKVKVNLSSEMLMDARSYYAFKLKNYGPYDAWVELVNSTKSSKTLKAKKLKELEEHHNILLKDTDYKFDYYINKEGGPDEVYNKWKNKVAEFAKTIKRSNLNKAAKEALSYRTSLFGNYYYTDKKKLEEADEETKKTINELVTMMFKCLPSFLGAFKRKGFLHSYTTGSLGDRAVFISVIKNALMEATHKSAEDINDNDSRIFNAFRSVYNELLKPFYEDGGEELARLLQYCENNKKIKV